MKASHTLLPAARRLLWLLVIPLVLTCPSLAPRTVGIDLAQLARVPEKILAAAGPHKVAIIGAVARRALIDTLITDDVTAELLLEAPARGGRSRNEH